jgi:predicted RND superfamily exporter protein
MGVLKDPVSLRTLDDFSKRYVSGLEEAGGSKSINDIVKYMNRIFHANDPKWAIIPNKQNDVASYIFQYMIGAGVPDALSEYIDSDVKNASLTIYLKDSMGSTISKAIKHLEELRNQVNYKSLNFKVMGGNIGVFAALNEYLESKNILLQAVTTLAIFLIVWAAYKDLMICIIAILPVLMANVITMAFMRLKGIGVNVSTLPVISIGAGVGIDYTIYMIDRLLHEFNLTSDGDYSVSQSIRTTGRAVLFTASTMILSLVIWYFSDVRFIAEMGILLAIMLFVHVATAIFLIPCLVRFFYFNRKLITAKQNIPLNIKVQDSI